MCITYVPDVIRDQNVVSDLLDLEFRVVVIHEMGAGNQTRILWESSRSSQLLTVSPASKAWLLYYIGNTLPLNI